MVEGQFDANAQRVHQNHSTELESRIVSIEALLANYIPTQFETADGRQLEVLARELNRVPITLSPFAIISAEQDGSDKVKVSLNSTLLIDIDPTNTVDITGLNTSMAVAAGDHIWLHIDLSATYGDSPGPPTGDIGSGNTWDGEVYPVPVKWDTSDGLGPTDTSDDPTNAKQTDIWVPIGYADDGSDSFGLVAAGFGLPLTGGIFVIQQLTTHLILGGACINGDTVQYALPFLGAQPG